MRHSPLWIRALQLSCLVLLFAPLAPAETVRGRIAVSVTVLARAMVRTESLPSELEISTTDIKRGYVERRRATRFLVGTVAPSRIVVTAVPTARIFSQVEIGTSGRDKATLGADGGQIEEWPGGRSDDPLLLDFRFKLLPGVAPGRYPWPVRVEVCLDY